MPTDTCSSRYRSAATHRTRRLGSIVRVTVIKTGRSISCLINDRGPFTRGLILDLSVGAARALGVRTTTKVRIQ